MMQKFWAVWRLNGGGAPNKRHDTLESAQSEASRLAGQSNEPYYVLEVIGAVVPVHTPIEWKEIK